MNRFPIELVEIGFHDPDALLEAISFTNENQNYFSFSMLTDARFIDYQPENTVFYNTKEIYRLIDCVFKDLKGFHNLTIGVVDKRLDGEKWGNLFGSMQTNENGRLTGKVITSIHGVERLIAPVPLHVYYCFELLSFSIRFIVGKGMIHDGERGCLFHRKVIKSDIVETIESGYISLDSLKTINKYLEFEQIQYIQSMLIKLANIARTGCSIHEINKENRGKASMSLDKSTPVFISYSHADTEWLKRLQIHLKPFERKGMISPWDDTKIKPGMKWKEQIIQALNASKIAILLVSADFLASDFIVDNELPPLLASAKRHGTTIVPVILKPCSFAESELGVFQSANPPSKPVINMTEAEQEELFFKIARTTNEAVSK
ncbi:TIR protein [Thiorhodococcus drewsii AZ1]|uniref:TIR protein n=1 Tax=Thiorhodococcus drewsii AZ1 TaxID=765913 RepID=G2DVU2_9GAMM|nr:toll/interleukin-1 receptor domain-containing protein [Thiorhodococcus drewsii]EGV33848.1 TIR protein [Thiorhodococcus drewsii AZ1]